MPTYVNPNPHPITIQITSPPTSLHVFPEAWAKSRIPDGGKQVVELDDRLARQFVDMGMLKLKHIPEACSSCRMKAAQGPNPAPTPEPASQAQPQAETPPQAPTGAQDPLSNEHPMRDLERRQDAAAMGDAAPASPPRKPAKADKPARRRFTDE